MYITSHQALEGILAERALKRDEIREKTAQFLKCTYGNEIPLCPIEALGLAPRAKPYAFLARELASACVEDITFELCTSHLGYEPLTVSFVRDSFITKNRDKVSRVKIPKVGWAKSGNRLFSYERINAAPHNEIETRPLDRIRCKNGVSLPEHHLALRSKVGLQGEVRDISLFYGDLLARATHRPRSVFREMDEGREERVVLYKDEAILPRDRPPAEWYYPFFFSMFLDGSLVLFETYEDYSETGTGGMAGQYARLLFKQTMERIVGATGVAPLVVQIPFADKMRWCNMHLEDTEGLSQIRDAAKGLYVDDIVSFFGSVADSVVEFRT
jgi:hypothetical protein